MTTFDKRGEAFENRFAHDEELRFKATARRNKLLGFWAAELMGKKGSDADAYAHGIIDAEFQQGGDEAVFAKLKTDLGAAGIPRSDHQIRRTMEEMLEKAVEQIRTEVK